MCRTIAENPANKDRFRDIISVCDDLTASPVPSSIWGSPTIHQTADISSSDIHCTDNESNCTRGDSLYSCFAAPIKPLQSTSASHSSKAQASTGPPGNWAIPKRGSPRDIYRRKGPAGQKAIPLLRPQPFRFLHLRQPNCSKNLTAQSHATVNCLCRVSCEHTTVY